ncbi:MAG: hypothetical protein ACXVA9_14400, partial [Bdellovibrionales bacterium]
MKYSTLILFALYSLSASANFQGDMLRGKKGKSGGGANVQWTLADWLTQTRNWVANWRCEQLQMRIVALQNPVDNNLVGS